MFASLSRGYRVFQPDCGDGTKGGWWLLFKAGRGTGRHFFADFDTDGAINTALDVIQVHQLGTTRTTPQLSKLIKLKENGNTKPKHTKAKLD